MKPFLNQHLIGNTLKFFKAIVPFLIFLSLQSISAQDNLSDKKSENQNEVPKCPKNYTITKVSLNENADKTVQALFVKKHNANFYYLYSNDKNVIITKEEFDRALENEQVQEAKNNKANISKR